LIEGWESRDNVGAVDVPIKTLDQLITAYGRPKYIKIDVGGYELPVIRGLHTKVDLMSFEYHLNKDDFSAKLQIIEYIKRFGDLPLGIVGEGAPVWSLQWAKLDEFLTVFPDRIPNSAHVGDIFVHIL
jgi:Methyltransferase FkbM domain